MEQYVEFGRRRIHLSQEAQSTRYASNLATWGSVRKYSIRSSSVRLARRRLARGSKRDVIFLTAEPSGLLGGGPGPTLE